MTNKLVAGPAMEVFPMLFWLSLTCFALGAAWIVSGLVALLLVTRRHAGARASRMELVPVSVLKPVCGADPGLEQNLESFFTQRYAKFELIFGVTRADDPALEVVERLHRRFPAVECRVVVHGGRGALNPKVDNLLGMLPHAGHDLLVISDSNVRVPPHYVSELVAVRSASGAGLVTNLFAGVGENTLGATLENAQLAGFCAPGAALPTLLKSATVIGKSLMFSRSELDRLGGLDRLGDLLAEDFVIGKMFQRAHRPVVLAPSVLESRTSNLSLRGFYARHERWAMLRWRLRPVAALLEPLVSPLVLLPCAAHALGAAGLLLGVLLFMLRDAGAWWILRGPRHLHLPLLVAPLREPLMLVAWARAAFRNHVRWRGKTLRIDAGTLLFVEQSQ